MGGASTSSPMYFGSKEFFLSVYSVLCGSFLLNGMNKNKKSNEESYLSLLPPLSSSFSLIAPGTEPAFLSLSLTLSHFLSLSPFHSPVSFLRLELFFSSNVISE